MRGEEVINEELSICIFPHKVIKNNMEIRSGEGAGLEPQAGCGLRIFHVLEAGRGWGPLALSDAGEY
jgi:hypothetical protein